MGIAQPSRLPWRAAFRTPLFNCRFCPGDRASEAIANVNSPAANRSFRNLIQRLGKAGFSKDFIQAALLPDWWDDACSEDPAVLQDLEVRVARFLGSSVAAVSDPGRGLKARTYPAAQLRRVRDINRDRLGPAMHVAMQVAGAVSRNLRDKQSAPSSPPLPIDGLVWRGQIDGTGAPPRLTEVARDLWQRGIPVVFIDLLPSPSFQGMACIVDGRPVVLLGYKYDEPGRVAFLVAHEAGHIAAGDCAPDQPVVDEEEEISDDAEIEHRADLFATQVLVGDTIVPEVDRVTPRDSKELARQAIGIERETGADASSVIFAWARRTGDYATATMAVKALYRHTGARRHLHRLFQDNVDIDGAGETDRALLLLCAGSSSAVHETAAR